MRATLRIAAIFAVPLFPGGLAAQQPAVRLHVQMDVRHASEQNSMPIPAVRSLDGKLVLLAGRSASLWEIATGRELRRFEAGPGTLEATAVALSADTTVAAAMVNDPQAPGKNYSTQTLWLWDAATGREIRHWASPASAVRDLLFSADGTILLTYAFGVGVTLWDTATGSVFREIPMPASSTIVAKSLPGSPFLAVNSESILIEGDDGQIRNWNLATNAVSAEFSAAEIESVSSDGQFALSADGVLRNTATKTAVKEFGAEDSCFAIGGRLVLHGAPASRAWDLAQGSDVSAPEGLACAANPRILSRSEYVRSESNTAWLPRRVHHVHEASGKDAVLTDMRAAQRFTSIMFSTNGRWLLTRAEGGGYLAGTWFIWDALTGQLLRRSGIEGLPAGPSFAAINDTIVNAGASFQVSDIQSGAVLRSANTGEGRVNFGRSVLSRDGRRLLTWVSLDPNRPASSLGTRLWDTTTGQALQSFAGSSPSNATALSADGSLVLMAQITQDGDCWGVAVYDGGTGQRTKCLAFPQSFKPPDRIAISPDSRVVATTEIQRTQDGSRELDGIVRLWNLQSGTVTRVLPVKDSRGVLHAEFSPDGRWLLAKNDHLIEIFEAATGRSVRRWTNLEPVPAQFGVDSSFSSDGRFLALIDRNEGAQIVQIESGERVTLVMDGGGWMTVHSGGIFDTNMLESVAPAQWIAADDPLHAVPVEIFAQQYYLPRLLARFLAGENLPAVPSIAGLIRAQPEIQIASVEPSQTGTGLVDVTIEAKETEYLGRKSGARDLRLFRNGRMVGFREGALELQQGSAQIRFEGVRLSSRSPSSEFSAYAFNSDRVKGPTSAPVPFSDTAAAGEPRAYIVAIGVNEIPAIPALALRFAANDARRMSTTLEARIRQQQRFTAVTTMLLLSEAGQPSTATREHLQQTFQQLARDVRPEDLVLISYSGHGFAEAGKPFHIYPSDVRGSGQAVPLGAVSSDDLTEWLRPIDSEQMVLILDSCQSAASVESGGFRPGPMGDRGFGQLAFDKRMRILAASQPADVALENESLEQGLLGYALVRDGLDLVKADWEPVDGRIALGEWLAYSVNRVPQLYEEIRDGKKRAAVPTGGRIAPQKPALFDFTRQTAEAGEDIVLATK